MLLQVKFRIYFVGDTILFTNLNINTNMNSLV